MVGWYEEWINDQTINSFIRFSHSIDDSIHIWSNLARHRIQLFKHSSEQSWMTNLQRSDERTTRAILISCDLQFSHISRIINRKDSLTVRGHAYITSFHSNDMLPINLCCYLPTPTDIWLFHDMMTRFSDRLVVKDIFSSDVEVSRDHILHSNIIHKWRNPCQQVITSFKFRWRACSNRFKTNGKNVFDLQDVLPLWCQATNIATSVLHERTSHIKHVHVVQKRWYYVAVVSFSFSAETGVEWMQRNTANEERCTCTQLW